MKTIMYLFYIALFIIIVWFSAKKTLEAFSGYNLEQSSGEYPVAQTSVLVQDIYKPKGSNVISSNSASDIWDTYPTFSLGSYEQVTNNIKYPTNPDIGRCMPSSMCGALYDNNYVYPDGEKKSDEIQLLPPTNLYDDRTRVGYFFAE
jgi:hypothetical protein